MSKPPSPFPPKSWLAGGLPDGDTRLSMSGELEPGDLSFPGYEVERLLGAGGMGAVYQVRQLDTGARRALKTLKMEAASLEARQRFQVEIESLGALARPNVVRVHAADLNARRPYVVMELVEGVELADVIAEPWEEERAARFIEKVLRALSCVHERGVIHRDLKPQNIFLCEGDEPKLADFGLARIREGEGLTQTGDVLGTPAFMAPEQILGLTGTVGPAADIWAVGVILFRLLTGRLPFAGNNAMGMMSEIVTGRAPLLSSVSDSIDRDLEEIVARALKREAEKRYPSAAAMADDLARFLAGETPEARLRTRRFERRGIVIGGVIIALLFLALTLWFINSAQRARNAELIARGQEILERFEGDLAAAPLLREKGGSPREQAREILELIARGDKQTPAIAAVLSENQDAASAPPLAAALERRRRILAGLASPPRWPAEDVSKVRALTAKALLARICAGPGAETSEALAAVVRALAPWLGGAEPGKLKGCGLVYIAEPSEDPVATRRFLALFGGSLLKPGRFAAVCERLPDEVEASFEVYLGRCYRGLNIGRSEDWPWIIDNRERLERVGALAARPEIFARGMTKLSIELLEAPPLDPRDLSGMLEAKELDRSSGAGLVRGPHPWLSPEPRARLLTALETLARLLEAGAAAFSQQQRGEVAKRLRETLAFGALHAALWYRPALFDRLAQVIDGSGLAADLYLPASWFRLSSGAAETLDEQARLDEELAALEEVAGRGIPGFKLAEDRRRQRLMVLRNRKAAALMRSALTLSGPGEARRIVKWWRRCLSLAEDADARRRMADLDRVCVAAGDGNLFMEYAWLDLRLTELSEADRAAGIKELRRQARRDMGALATLIEARVLHAQSAAPEAAFLERADRDSRQFIAESFYTEYLCEWFELRTLLAELSQRAGEAEKAEAIARDALRVLAGMEAPPAQAWRQRLESGFPQKTTEGERGHDDGGQGQR